MKAKMLNKPGERKSKPPHNRRKGPASLKAMVVESCGLTRSERDECDGKRGGHYCPDRNRCTHWNKQ